LYTYTCIYYSHNTYTLYNTYGDWYIFFIFYSWEHIILYIITYRFDRVNYLYSFILKIYNNPKIQYYMILIIIIILWIDSYYCLIISMCYIISHPLIYYTKAHYTLTKSRFCGSPYPCTRSRHPLNAITGEVYYNQPGLLFCINIRYIHNMCVETAKSRWWNILYCTFYWYLNIFCLMIIVIIYGYDVYIILEWSCTCCIFLYNFVHDEWWILLTKFFTTFNINKCMSHESLVSKLH